MKVASFFILLQIMILQNAHSEEIAVMDCQSSKPNAPELKNLTALSSDMKMSELKTIAESSKDRVTKYFLDPTKKTCSSVSYTFPDEKMTPGDSVYFHIPEDIRDRGVRFMVLGHRQEPEPGWKEGAWDDKPGLSSVEVYSNKKWSYWNGPASGKKGAKFAENRSTAEIENLYDWSKYGHKDSETDELSKETLLPEAMKVESVGVDNVYLSELTLKVEPFKETSNQEKIFSKGTTFNPQGKGEKYTLGGGQKFKGTFPGAHVLYPGAQMTIDLEEGKKVTSVDIACGDSHQDQQQNSDGGWGQQGWAKLSIGIQKPDGSITWIMKRENVPPEGVMMASSDDCEEKMQKGSKLIIKADSDTIYVMGVHVGYR